ncbi:unnamed protein product [Nezara viridula]|uniref:Uncharacterized protein n=1 Tax=Nezara viridula TaxID=85310 RepID=A0A9P0EDN8_NEZVI|nr:unnamed protein product [Nezara viridula]
MDQTVYGLVSKRARQEERTPADRVGQGDEEDLRGSSLEESSIREERMEKDGTANVMWNGLKEFIPIPALPPSHPPPNKRISWKSLIYSSNLG